MEEERGSACGPLTRITPSAPPWAVAMAQIVSDEGKSTGGEAGMMASDTVEHLDDEFVN